MDTYLLLEAWNHGLDRYQIASEEKGRVEKEKGVELNGIIIINKRTCSLSAIFPFI